MDSLFIIKQTQPVLEVIIFFIMISGLALIRSTNTNYSYFLINNLLTKQDAFYKSLSNVNLKNKSTIFLNVNFIFAGAMFLTKIYNVKFIETLLVLLLYKIVQFIILAILEKVFLTKETIISFTKRRIALTELTGVILLFFILFTNFTNPNIDLLISLTALVMIIIWVKIAAILGHYISVFHIILYLCTLEILPILFLVKFIHEYLA
jgi:hypothetical protein